MGKVTYFAMLGFGASRDNPIGIARRRIVDDVRFDEVFTRNLRWEPTEYFVLYMLGHNEIEHVEINKQEADAFVARISARATRDG
ncbi:hypothetical protein ACFV2H_37715 [Streptomyces sp. NPDC059629]|uniref:hypothetical protein n=1 Tax=Streptomyces sp. NPDC059629 TaxID=3346889 RepID=UPI0036BF3B6D